MGKTEMGRRTFMSSSAGTAMAAALGTAAAGVAPGAARAADREGVFTFEVTRSDAEWRERLSDEDFRILRQGSTELPNTSPLVNETADGVYCCKGCDLRLYQSVWKVPLDVGWVFFSHAEPRTVLTGIDGDPPDGMGDSAVPAMIEVHCRRCGSHQGHIVIAKGQLLHCINGSALRFRADRA